MRGFLRSVGLDWRFLLLICLSTILTALFVTGPFFPFGLIFAVGILPISLPGAIIGWCLVFWLASRDMERHEAAMLAAGAAGLTAVLGMILFSFVFTPDPKGFLELSPYIAVAACVSGVNSAWLI